MPKPTSHSFIGRGIQSTLVCLTITISCGFSQSNSFVPKSNNVPSSPEVALLGRFGEMPVGTYTGTARISIPIYTITEGGVEIPIKLDYHASGIKVADEATWVGLGWSLVPEGTIIQEIRGKEDDLDDNLGYYGPGGGSDYNQFKSRMNFYTPALQLGDALKNLCRSDFTAGGGDPYSIVYALNHGEGEPDIYTYNFAGHSGSFFINPETGQIIFINRSESIMFEKLGNGWKVTTLDGDKFYFQTLEITSPTYEADWGTYQGKTYKLSNVQLTSGKSIMFTYADERYTDYSRTEIGVVHGRGPNELEENFSVRFTYQLKKSLTRIETSDAIIEFNLEDRNDILFPDTNTPAKRLKSIDIKSKSSNKKVKSFAFSYSYFPYNFVGCRYSSGSYLNIDNTPISPSQLDQYGLRLKLDALQEVGYDSNGAAVISIPPYQFGYNLSTTMPLKISYAIDLWGYYNGSANIKLLPDLQYFDFLRKPRFQITSQEFFKYPYAGANRYTNNTFAAAYMLNSIVYPTGGRTDFEFEPHTFTNQFIPTQQEEQVAHKLILLEDENGQSDVKTSVFQLTRAATISFNNRIYDGYSPYQTTPLTYDQMMGSFIQLSKLVKDQNGNVINTTILKRWDLTMVLRAQFESTHQAQWTEDVNIAYDATPNTFYEVVVFLPDAIENNTFGSINVTSRFEYYDDSGVDTSVSRQCGLRVKSIKSYSNTNALLTEKRYQYYEGKLLSKFDPLETKNVKYFTCSWQPLSQTAWRMQGNLSYLKRVSLTTDNLIGGDGNLIGYGKVEEIQTSVHEQLTTNGKTVLIYHNEPNIEVYPDQGIKSLPEIRDLKNGLMLEELVYDRNNVLLTRKKNYTSNHAAPGYSSVYGIKIRDHSIGPTDLNFDPGQINVSQVPVITGTVFYEIPAEPTNKVYKYSYPVYWLQSEWHALDSVVTFEYAGGQALKTKEQYSYNALAQKIATTSINSKGETIVTKVIYPEDDITGSMQADLLKFKGLYSSPLENITIVNGSEINKMLYDYAYNKNLETEKVVNTSVSTSYHQSAPTREITFDLYDQNKRLLQYTEKGIVKSFLWGYGGSHLVAIIIGLDHATVAQYITQTQIDQATASGETALRSLLATLRTNIPAAIVTSYTYMPLVGVTSQTDPSGRTTYYEYDVMGRLVRIKDHDGNIMSAHRYIYGQN